MESYKGLFASKTVWGGIAALLAGVAALLGYAVSADDVATLTELLTGIAAAAGGLIAIWGRATATKKIK